MRCGGEQLYVVKVWGRYERPDHIYVTNASITHTYVAGLVYERVDVRGNFRYIC